MDLSNFVVRVGEVAACIPCVSFVLYLDETDDAGLLNFYQRSMEALGGLITHYATGSMTRRARLTERALTMVPTWLEKPQMGKTYVVDFFGCDLDRGVTGAGIELTIRRRPTGERDLQQTEENAKRKKLGAEREILLGRLTTILRVCLPVDHPLGEPSKLLEWVLGFRIVRAWPFLSGYCGFALNHYSAVGSLAVRRVMQMQMASFCLRYPGLDWQEPGLVASQLLRSLPGIPYFLPLVKRVNWLTLLCDKTIDYLGGRDVLLQRLRNDMSITTYREEHGLVIQAGETPQLGDIGHRDFIPVYRHVAAVVRPVRLEKTEGAGIGFSDDAANEWLNAFDKHYE